MGGRLYFKYSYTLFGRLSVSFKLGADLQSIGRAFHLGRVWQNEIKQRGDPWINEVDLG